VDVTARRSGILKMLDDLITEGENPRTRGLDRFTAAEIVEAMCDEDATVVAAIRTESANVAAAIELVAERMRGGGRLIYVGAGTSGRLGVLDAAECPPTFHSDPGQVIGVIAGGPAAVTRSIEGAEDDANAARRDLEALDLSARDVVAGIAASGRTPYVLEAVAWARERGAATIGISCNPGAPLAAAVEVAITPVVGPEVIAGSTRLKAGTATKLVLNMLSTGAMVRLGKVHGNLMVDLRATSEKLRARARGIVGRFTGCGPEEVDRLLEATNWEAKTAIVTGRLSISPDEARARLSAAGGRLRAVIGDPS
jgi:N-acetylmuramic acid 6-phosphate etherase